MKTSFTPPFLSRPLYLDNPSTVSNELKTIAHAHALAVDKLGHFKEISLIGWLWEQFKEILGLDNRTNPEVLRFRVLQLVAESAEKGLITKNDCSGVNSLVHRAAQKVGLIPNRRSPENLNELNSILQTIIQYVEDPKQTPPNFKNLIENYRVHYLDILTPHSFLDRIRLPWQQNHEEFPQSESELMEKQDDESSSEFSDQSPEIEQANQLFSQKVPKQNPMILDLLLKLADTTILAKQLEDLASQMPSSKASYKDLYLKLLFTNPSKIIENEKLIQEWVSDILSLSTNWPAQWGPKAANIDQELQFLNFNNAFALISAAYRLSHLIKNEEEKQQDPSQDLIKQCQHAIDFFGSRLEKLILEHPSDYQNLDLTDLSPQNPTWQFDLSVPYQFLYELMKQQRLNEEKNKKTLYRSAGIGLLSVGALAGGAIYLVKELCKTPPPPVKTSFFPFFEINLWNTVNALGAAVIIGGTLTWFYRFKSKSGHSTTPGTVPATSSAASSAAPATSSTSSGTVPGTPSVPVSTSDINSIIIKLLTEMEIGSCKDYVLSNGLLKEENSLFDYASSTLLRIYGGFTKFEGIRINKDLFEEHELKADTEIIFTVFKHAPKNSYFLITNIAINDKRYVNITNLGRSSINIKEIENILNHTNITDNEIIIPFIDKEAIGKLEKLNDDYQILSKKIESYQEICKKFDSTDNIDRSPVAELRTSFEEAQTLLNRLSNSISEKNLNDAIEEKLPKVTRVVDGLELKISQAIIYLHKNAQTKINAFKPIELDPSFSEHLITAINDFNSLRQTSFTIEPFVAEPLEEAAEALNIVQINLIKLNDRMTSIKTQITNEKLPQFEKEITRINLNKIKLLQMRLKAQFEKPDVRAKELHQSINEALSDVDQSPQNFKHNPLAYKEKIESFKEKIELLFQLIKDAQSHLNEIQTGEIEKEPDPSLKEKSKPSPLKEKRTKRKPRVNKPPAKKIQKVAVKKEPDPSLKEKSKPSPLEEEHTKRKPRVNRPIAKKIQKSAVKKEPEPSLKEKLEPFSFKEYSSPQLPKSREHKPIKRGTRKSNRGIVLPTAKQSES